MFSQADRLTNPSSLFDMDGTLVSDASDHADKDSHMAINEVDSTSGVNGAWESFATTYPGLNVPEILSRMTLFSHSHVTTGLYSFRSIEAHGVRTVDNLRRYCGIEDAETLVVS